jgi:DNA (cytosine-5)-methyltransferase 1
MVECGYTFALGFHATQDPISSDDISPSISREHSGSAAVFAIPLQERQRDDKRVGIGVGRDGDPMYMCTTRGAHGVFAFDEVQITHPENRSTVSPGRPVPTVSNTSRLSVAGGMRPRRLSPREVERCFGFPDDYTLIEGAIDSARYRALGNSMAVPVMRWIGKRLLAVEAILGKTR